MYILGMAARVTSGARRSGRAQGKRLQPSREAVQVAAAFRASLRRFERTSERIALECGLTPRRYLLLLMVKGTLDGSERATVGDLAERLQLARHTVTGLIGRAASAGLVCREGSASDGRLSYVRLTAEGERRLAGAFNDYETERRALMAALRVSRSAAGRRG